MNVVFRTDAGRTTGIGHLMRCLVIAAAVRDAGGKCWFICQLVEPWLSEMIIERGHRLVNIGAMASNVLADANDSAEGHGFARGQKPANDWLQDCRETISRLPDIRIDWLVVDHYSLDERWEQAVAGRARAVLVIDDLADRQHACDLLLDQNPGRSAQDYAALLPASCKVIVGPKYALLREEFCQHRAASVARRRADEYRVVSVLVTMGGSDPGNLTADVLRLLGNQFAARELSLDVVLGAAAPWLENVQAIATSSALNMVVHHNVKNMAVLMASSDLCIGAAGSTALERCVLGLPTIAIVVADNQQSGANALNRCGAHFLVNGVADVPAAMADLTTGGDAQRRMQMMSESALTVTDGKGGARVLACMEQLL
jgi:UDP-2,4-diacetamido-2,4,6-trideoxy-beta-L-altropyranose hydrolase